MDDSSAIPAEAAAATAIRRTPDGPMSMAEALQPSMLSGYSGANFSTRRGKLWWPTLDTRRELDSFSRDEILRRVRWLRANVGVVKGFIKNGAMLVGYLTPSAETKDAEWNALANANFRQRAGSKELFDVAGKFNFFTAQSMLMRSALTDGDHLTALTSNPYGGAAFAFYEAHQLRQPKGAKDKRWKDGILTSPAGRHLLYGVGDAERVDAVAARDAIYFGQFERSGHHRAHPPLAHAVNHALDITETWGDVKSALKINGLSGLARTQKLEHDFGRDEGMVGQVNRRLIKKSDGTTSEYKTEEVFAGGQIPKLAPGEDLKVISDPRPHQNHRDFTGDLMRDMSNGYGLPLELTWQIANLNSAGVRYVLDVADRWIKDWQLELTIWCHRVWAFHIAKEIKAGRLPLPQDENWLHAVSWTPRRNLTIDRGKESKMRLDEIDAGCGTWSDFYREMDGSDWRPKIRQRIAEKKFAMEECEREEIPFEKVFPPRQGAASPSATKDGEEPAGRQRESASTEEE